MKKSKQINRREFLTTAGAAAVSLLLDHATVRATGADATAQEIRLRTGNFALFLHKIRKDYDEAERLYKRALELDPGHRCVEEQRPAGPKHRR